MTTPLRLSVISNDNSNSNKSLPPYSDKANLPQSVLSELVNTGIELPHPLIFRISNDSDPFIYTYIGVKEFTSNSGEIQLPSFITTKLHQPTDVVIELQPTIPKATSLRLKPRLFYANITNWKFFLENRLTQYTVVNQGDCLTIEDDGLKYELEIEQINDSDTVTVASIIDTDTVVDMVPLNESAAEQQLEFYKAHHDQLSSIHELEMGQEVVIRGLKSFMQPQFIPQIYKIDLLKWIRGGGGDGGDIIRIELEMVKTNDAAHLINADCLVGPSKFLTIENFAYSTLNEDENVAQMVVSGSPASKSISIDLNRDELILNKLNRCKRVSNDDVVDDGENDERYLYLIPFTWQGDEDMVLRVTSGNQSEVAQGTETGTINDDSMKQCPNCSKLIPKKNFLLHESRCRRQNVEPVDAKLMQFKHMQLYEKKYQCCSQEFDSFFDMVTHKSVTCPKTLHECRFCHLIVPRELATYQDKFEDLTHHENLCGNKTQECFKCGKIIRRKDLSKHMKMHELEKAEYSQAITFRKCSNVNCINEASANALNLCDLCFGPLYIAQHDPSNIKLQSRIERKYMLQLSKGCGHSWCNNEYCKSGNHRLSNNSMKENMQLINELFASIHQPRLPISEKNGVPKDSATRVYFCVNESVSNKNIWFDILKSEGGYAEEVILQALKVNNDELSTRQWLKDNAISKS
ncbi:hypothetical protein CANMA_000709 [Candida margitis]|uniref:uncharacterized protein n=1 Tax=Candida margitis TaxID=1775924 RepID=UPI00222755D1|nr:uncharacterized protein CANMA_000709 [Candida margitis]KAI5970098.1 hypothetical protein CANMA_000709 [Candida margitis]